MLTVITGKQRAGKTYFVVRDIIITTLKDTSRPVFTNLPINPDQIAKKLAKNPLDREKYLERINLFLPTDYASLRGFQTRNPLYWSMFCRGNRNEINIISETEVSHFWDYTKPNSVICFDEIYEVFSCMNFSDRSEGMQDNRKKLLSYSRQHGHRKDDLYLISHSERDLDSFIRRGIQYLYVIRNSKYSNMFETKFFRGLKWPWQFFIVQGYEHGETKPSDRWFVPSEPEIFKCYESFSHTSKLGLHSVSQDAKSTDINRGLGEWFKDFWKQFKFWLILFFAILIGFIFFVRGIMKMAKVNSKTFVGKNYTKEKGEEKNVDIENNNPGYDLSNDKEDVPIRESNVKAPVPVMRAPDMVIYSNGKRIKVGTKITKKIGNQTAIFEVRKIDNEMQTIHLYISGVGTVVCDDRGIFR
jgi:hypothetical protein